MLNIMGSKIVLVYDFLLSGVRVGIENGRRWLCPRYRPVCCKTCGHRFTGVWGMLAAEGWGEQPWKCVADPGCRVLRRLRPVGGDGRSTGISSKYVGPELCKELSVYQGLWG